jgi:HK97 gp10 family phage protein
MDEIEKLIDELEEYPEIFLTGAEKGIKKAAVKIQTAAKLLAPVDTGRLRNSITVQTEKTLSEATATVGTNVKYAPYMEFGTGSVGAASKKELPPDLNIKYTSKKFWVYKDEKGEFKRSHGNPAKPFLYPAIKEVEPDIEKYVVEAIREEIDKNA